jgi:hypothetical protein
MPNRSSNGSRRGTKTVEGSLDIRFMRAAFMDVLLQSGLSGTYATNVLKAGTTDSYFSIISSYQGGAAGSQMHEAFAGVTVKGFSITTKALEGVTTTFDLMGMDFAELTTDNPLAVTGPGAVTEFKFDELAAITVAGQTLKVAELSFETSLDRTRRHILTSATGLQFGVNGTRTTTVTIKAFREDFVSNTAITGNAQAVSFDIGGVGTGYRFQLPAAYGDRPASEVSDGSLFQTITFKAGYDATAATDLVVTRL